MNFEPMNRHLLIEPIEENQEQENVILLPEEYRPQKSPYLYAKVLAKARNVEIPVEVGDTIVCERRMLHMLPEEFYRFAFVQLQKKIHMF